ncbi:hypothetical protein KVR01_011975 [Diaporthe batatas]|uniref:uncharacterized protein n=1 Tax=Diaporthe batatas TaxID=748121 RepID=UPI001D04077D|nr:uncharacterized protein KVR01_011975 [Diaporthe batatas]KAG8158214.1 hypothetical protein KVR01_011975 [Diaporthe batatas]
MSDTPTSRRFARTCDACKARKVRCSGYPGPCLTCIRRKDTCHFSPVRPARRHNVNLDITVHNSQSPGAHGPPTTSASAGGRTVDKLPSLYVDKLLAQARTNGGLNDSKPIAVQGNEIFVGNYRMTFFSDHKLLHLSKQLQNSKVDELLGQITSLVQSRLPRHDTASTKPLQLARETRGVVLGASDTKLYLEAYFTRAYPLFPFLDRKAFEAALLGPTFLQELNHNKAWLALYNAILAIGCQLYGEGSYQPGRGNSWALFSTSMAVFSELLSLPDSILVLQALTAMSIYSLSISCMAIEHVVIQEAARRAQNLRSHKLPESDTLSYQKAFWILYSVEKISSFHFGRSSAFADHDISVPIPIVPEAIFGEYDWLLANARYSRLLSRAASSLFCAGVTGNTEEYFLEVIDQLEHELDNWRMTTPVSGEPNDTSRINLIESSLLRTASVWTHLMYHSLRLALCRARLHLAAKTRGLVTTASQAESTSIMSEAARNILELAAFIDVSPSTPFWFVAGIPVAALLVVFDVVISHPRHPETNTNLALLDVGGGHFSRIEYASAGWLPGSLLTQFSQIAREYVNKGKTNDGSSVPPGGSQNERVTSISSGKEPQPAVHSELGATGGPPLQPAFDTVPIASGDQELTLSDMLYCPMGDDPSQFSDGLLTGMDLMGLFHSSIPWDYRMDQ